MGKLFTILPLFLFYHVDQDFSNFLKQVDGKIWRVHLLISESRLTGKSMITERNKQKRQDHSDPAHYWCAGLFVLQWFFEGISDCIGDSLKSGFSCQASSWFYYMRVFKNHNIGVFSTVLEAVFISEIDAPLHIYGRRGTSLTGR